MTNVKRTLIAFLTASLFAFVTTGFAGDTDKDKDTTAQDTTKSQPHNQADDKAKPSFETVDSNLDGVITPTEAEGSWLAQKFADADSNQDGLINRSEYDTAMS